MTLQPIAHFLTTITVPAMAVWLFAGLVAIGHAVYSLMQERVQLDQAFEIMKGVRESDYEGKKHTQIQLFKWADANPKFGLSHWVSVAHNAAIGGAPPDPGAMTDAIWSRERHRHRFFHFIQRNSILVGLFFTSAGLIQAIGTIGPAIKNNQGDFDAWTNAVRAAMSASLGGMSEAFTSSLLGMAIALILQFIWTVAQEGKWNQHILDLDALIQGRMIPVFTSLAQRDRNDVITLALTEMKSALTEVKDQYGSLFENTETTADRVEELHDQFTLASTVLREATEAVAKEHKALATASKGYQEGATKVAQAVHGAGLELAQASRSIGSQFNQVHADGLQQLQVCQTNLLGQLQQLSSKMEEGNTLAARNNENAGHVLGMVNESNTRYANLAHNMERFQQLSNAMAHSVHDLTQGMQVLGKNLALDEGSFQAEMHRRRSLLEDSLTKAGAEGGRLLAQEMQTTLSHHLLTLGRIIQQQAESAYKAQADAEATRDRRWNELVSALGGGR